MFCFFLCCFVVVGGGDGDGVGWGGGGNSGERYTQKQHTRTPSKWGNQKNHRDVYGGWLCVTTARKLQQFTTSHTARRTPHTAHRTPQLYDHAAQWLYHPLRKEHAHADTMDESELLESVKFQFESVRGCMAKVLTCIRGGDGFCLWYGIYM